MCVPARTGSGTAIGGAVVTVKRRSGRRAARRGLLGRRGLLLPDDAEAAVSRGGLADGLLGVGRAVGAAAAQLGPAVGGRGPLGDVAAQVEDRLVAPRRPEAADLAQQRRRPV